MIVTSALLVIEEVISSYKKAEISSHFKLWNDAMMEEMNCLHKNDTWKLIELPKEKKVINCKWVFVKK